MSSEVTATACSAVRDFGSFAASRDFLESSGLHDQLIELAKLNRAALDDAIASKRPSVAILNRPELIHFAMLFDDLECAYSLVASITDPTTLKYFPLSGVWKPYTFALAQFVTGKPIERPKLPKCKGYELFFLPYINYMDHPTAENMAAMATSFAKRNQDGRYTDWVGLDGDGKKPVQWDPAPQV